MTVRNRTSTVVATLVVTICAASALLIVLQEATRRAELAQAYARYLGQMTQAWIELDSGPLFAVAVNPRLAAATEGIEARREFTGIAAEEYQNIRVTSILQFSQVESVIEVRYEYRQFTQDFVTAQRNYGPSVRWRSRTERVVLVQDAGIWKVKETFFLDWSG